MTKTGPMKRFLVPMEEVLKRREERASKQKQQLLQQQSTAAVNSNNTPKTKRSSSSKTTVIKRLSSSKGTSKGISKGISKGSTKEKRLRRQEEEEHGAHRVIRRVVRRTAKRNAASSAVGHDDEVVYKDVLAAANCSFPDSEDEVVVVDSDDGGCDNKRSSRKKKGDSDNAAAAAEELIAEMEYFTDVGYRPRGGVYSYVCCPQQLNPTYEKYFTTQDGGRTSSSAKRKRAKGVGSAVAALASVGDATVGVKHTSAVFADAMLNKLQLLSLHDPPLPFPRAKICIVYLNVFDGWDSSECHRFSEYVIDGFDDKTSTEEEVRDTAREALCKPVESAPALARVTYANVFAALADLAGIEDTRMFSETIPGVQELYDVPLRYRSLFERTLEPDAKCLTLCYNWKKEEISPCALVNTALNRCSERAFGTPSPSRAAGYTGGGVSSPMFMEPLVLLGHVEYIKKHFIAPELTKRAVTKTPSSMIKTHRIALLQAKEHAERMNTDTDGLD
ncbi:hypothetical protein V5799_027486 [Amblyomma americanum]|uniref:Uncharacterized protein n=1 Tax=Amblyomma americanum TaxID=6943 RepID=A0AAQ4DFK7_AMBAM